MRKACEAGDLKLVKKQKFIFSVDSRYSSLGTRATFLMYACTSGSLELVQYLIEEKNALDSATDRNGCTPLMYACEFGHLSIVKYLREVRNVNLEHRNRFEENCLSQAAIKGHLHVVKYLIIEAWMHPPPCRPNYPTHVRSFLQQCSSNFLFQERLKHCFNMQVNKLGKRTPASPRKTTVSPFEIILPGKMCEVYELVESMKPLLSDLKVFIPVPPSEQSLHGTPSLIVHAKKSVLRRSCCFMEGLINSPMSDLQDDVEEDTQRVELAEGVLHGCNPSWVKHLVISLSWPTPGEYLQHVIVDKRKPIPFREFASAVKFLQICDMWCLNTNSTAWTSFIRSKVKECNKQWLDEKRSRQKPFCISDIQPFNQEMASLWISVLGGDSNWLHMFILTHASRDAPSVSKNSASWLVKSPSYWIFLSHSRNAGRVFHSTGFNIHSVEGEKPKREFIFFREKEHEWTCAYLEAPKMEEQKGEQKISDKVSTSTNN